MCPPRSINRGGLSLFTTAKRYRPARRAFGAVTNTRDGHGRDGLLIICRQTRRRPVRGKIVEPTSPLLRVRWFFCSTIPHNMTEKHWISNDFFPILVFINIYALQWYCNVFFDIKFDTNRLIEIKRKLWLIFFCFTYVDACIWIRRISTSNFHCVNICIYTVSDGTPDVLRIQIRLGSHNAAYRVSSWSIRLTDVRYRTKALRTCVVSPPRPDILDSFRTRAACVWHQESPESLRTGCLSLVEMRSRGTPYWYPAISGKNLRKNKRFFTVFFYGRKSTGTFTRNVVLLVLAIFSSFF